MGAGSTQPDPLPNEISKCHSSSPSIIFNRDMLYPVKGQIQSINKI